MKNIDFFKNKLKEFGKNAEETIKTMNENRTADQEANYPTELSNYDNHPADTSTQLYTLGLNNALMIHQENLLGEVRNALEKIENGAYGSCELCGKEIDENRLKAIPYTRLCLECEEEKRPDQEIIRNMRPNEELVLDAPMGRKYLNKQEDDEYEGLDILNDLMKYGSSDTPQDMGGYHDYEDFYTNKTDKQGIVDDMDQVSNEEYKKNLE
ncbi:MAG TPA: TraR/DksA C4-type zinc finger protein [Clostridiales bacterium]|nr:TraR/DksA C4-type zinc finger protein [Clostridiales bacterium]